MAKATAGPEMAAEVGRAFVEEGLATVGEAVKFLRFSRSTLYALMDSGQLPYARIGTGQTRSARHIPRAMNLPPRMKAKERSSRRNKFVDKHGDDVFELEAVAPERLQAICKDAIDSILDVAAFHCEVETEKQEARRLAGIHRKLTDQLQDLRPEDDE